MAFLADKPGMAEAAVFGAVVLLAGACEVGDLSVVWTFRSVLEGTWEFWMCVGLSGMWLGVDGAYRSRCERKLALDSTEWYGMNEWDFGFFVFAFSKLPS